MPTFPYVISLTCSVSWGPIYNISQHSFGVYISHKPIFSWVHSLTSTLFSFKCISLSVLRFLGVFLSNTPFSRALSPSHANFFRGVYLPNMPNFPRCLSVPYNKAYSWGLSDIHRLSLDSNTSSMQLLCLDLLNIRAKLFTISISDIRVFSKGCFHISDVFMIGCFTSNRFSQNQVYKYAGFQQWMILQLMAVYNTMFSRLRCVQKRKLFIYKNCSDTNVLL